jgi:hypothetical protein
MEEQKDQVKSFDEQIYANMQQNYYGRLKEVTRRLRQIEKDQLERFKRVYGVSGDEQLKASELDS